MNRLNNANGTGSVACSAEHIRHKLCRNTILDKEI